MKIKSCEFNMDTASIEIVYQGGNMMSLYIPWIEDEMRTTVYSKSKMDLMLDNEPLEYAKMVFDSTMQAYLDRVDGIGRERVRSYTERLEQRFPKNIAKDIAREMLMYE